MSIIHVAPVLADSFLVRLNLSSHNVQYVGAQIVRANSIDDVQVRGIENPHAPVPPTAMDRGGLAGVQGTKLQYVSNQVFEEELTKAYEKNRSTSFELGGASSSGVGGLAQKAGAMGLS